MKKGGGRAKGSGFEREVARSVIKTFKKFGIRKADCYRTPLSGGHRAAREKDPGDLVISEKLVKYFPFSVECKAWKRIELFPLWLPFKKHKKAWKFKQWIDQACAACTKDRHPLLVFKANNFPVMCALPELMPLIALIPRRHRFIYNGEVWYVVRFSDLLRRMRDNVV